MGEYMRRASLRKHYRLLIDEFVQHSKAGGATVVTRDSEPITVRESEQTTDIFGLFYLKDWPYRATSRRNKPLDILLRAREVFKADSAMLVASTVQVMYFDSMSNDDFAKPILGVHYDYKYGMEVAHPLFHAQLGWTAISPEELETVRFQRQIVKGDDALKCVRIPTVHIGLPAALLGLVADHLPPDIFSGFLKRAREHELFKDVRTSIDCRSTHIREQDPEMFQSHHLYNGH